MNMQMFNAFKRAFRTFGQTFFGSLGAIAITLDASFTTAAATSAIGAGIAAGAAFFMNLKE